MNILDYAIRDEVQRILNEEEDKTENLGEALSADEDSDPRESLKKLSNFIDMLSQKDEVLSGLLAPLVAIRDVIGVAIPAAQLALNDMVLIVKAPLAIRPSSWKRAVREHAKRKTKLTKKYDAAMKASGADSSLASIISFLAMPQAAMQLKISSLPIKAVAGVNRALIDSGIRLPLVGLLPGAEPPEEAEMSDKDLDDKKRGELGTKDAIKLALMSIFFAHHQRPGSVLAEKAEENKRSSEAVSSKNLKKYLVDVGVYSVLQSDLTGLFESSEKSIDNFLGKELWREKVSAIGGLLAAESPEDFIKKGNAIGSADLKQSVDKYVSGLKKSAEKLANDKEFQESISEKLKNESEGEEELSADSIKKASLDTVFARTQPEFRQKLSESLNKYITFLITAVEAEYPSKDHPKIKIALKNPIVKKAYEKKDAIIDEILSNIPK